ncbi:MAG: AbrB/MazE/SpoVT family DNA-binding domain-containing protein [Halobacteria archaeon]
MSTTHLDAKGRLLIPRRVRRAAGLEEGEELLVKVPEEGTVLLRRIRKTPGGRDPFLEMLKKPAHVSREKLRRFDLEALKDEAWTP